MTLRQLSKTIGSGAAIVALGMFIASPRRQASGENDDQTDRNNDESRIKRGFAIAPVPLNMEGMNPALVGLGSYIANAVADCNGCHSAGPPTEFVKGGVRTLASLRRSTPRPT